MPSANAAAPPGPPVRSVTRTWAPAAAALNAAADPAAPTPTTITSAVSSQSVISPASHGVTSFGSRTPSSLRCRRDGRRCCRAVSDVLPSGACLPHPPPPAPVPPVAPPPELAQLAPGWAAVLAWRLVPYLTTWRLTGPDGTVRFAKVASDGDRYPTLRGEAERMVWAAPYLPVPKVVTLEQLGDSTILLTEALPGRDATHAAWRTDLPGLVRALGRGLRSFHDAVGEEWCPFRFDLARALAHVEERVRTGDINP